MVHEVIWTKTALASFGDNIAYLADTWTVKEVNAFAILVDKKIQSLSLHPEIGKPAKLKGSKVRLLVLHKRINLIYRLKKRNQTVELLLFWNTYHNPAKLN